MAVLKIAKLGNPVLRKIALPVAPEEIRSRPLQQFSDDMLETMRAAEGIGLAAPQVSRSEQIIVMECRGEEGFPERVLINPTIVYYGPHQVEMWEGCLSVDGLRGKVLRPSMIRVQGLDRKGSPVDFEATGLRSEERRVGKESRSRRATGNVEEKGKTRKRISKQIVVASAGRN